jgi:hypothetical protein
MMTETTKELRHLCFGHGFGRSFGFIDGWLARIQAARTAERLVQIL